ncbi:MULTISPECIES: helix-turn-helix domain-containing protein [Streptococcus]|uniref:DNA binding domain, excisionase family n=1 Tax=Streptococcus acidominimus TaxID=1326 RepID=A0A1Q8EB84_STRAI|nr:MULTISPECIES: helix-turn-helix domain-containing protein [Streptococcus]MBM7193365.1 helix-turn-helix domain-containing protein [Streptococcus suis]MCK4024557.1 helix-turn-helix domain-containing protein [Streptococcus suis]MCO8225622.1 helix-turn-helix domain-containing protein [Streptococcus suis]NQI45419.1 helix-turn-helix domain-containing protein [Streptococcus suis]NQK11472.1 helix-turn-helix domain-containing protein [Streptococcus suis]
MANLNTYTLEEVEDILKVTRRTIYNYIKNGDLKAVKMGKYWRVSEANLQDFIEHGTKKKG